MTLQTDAAQPTYQPTPTPAPAAPSQPSFGTQGIYDTGQPPAQPAYQGQAYGQQQPYQDQTPYNQLAVYTQNAYQQPGYSQPGMGPQIPQTPTYPIGTGYAYTGEPAINAPWYGIDFLNACKRFFRKYATYSGRASRGEYWWAYLMNVLIFAVIGALKYLLGYAGFSLSGLILLTLVVPAIAVRVRRLHDSNMSGLWCLLPIGLESLSFLPLVTGFMLLFIGVPLASVALLFIGRSIFVIGGIIFLYGLLMIRPSNPRGAQYDQSS